MISPPITVTIATYNMAGTLLRAIDSVLSQSFKAFEILILDDGSTDETGRVLYSLSNHPQVSVLHHKSRQGLSECRNRLLREARGELLSILDADDVFLPNKLASHYQFFKENDALGMVWGRAVIRDMRTGELEVMPRSNYFHEWDLIESYSAVHSATTWKKTALQSTGGYDPSRTLVEDADMFLKVGDHFEQYYSPELVAVKFRDTANEFRKSSRDKERAHWTSVLLSETIRRRYQITFREQRPV